MSWEPLVDVSEESMCALVQETDPESVLHRVTRRILTGLGDGPDGTLSAFQSVVDAEESGLMAGFSSAV